MLSHGRQELVSPEQDLPHASEHTLTPGRRKESLRLNSTHETTDTALPPETVGAQATELFLFMPYLIRNQSYFYWI